MIPRAKNVEAQSRQAGFSLLEVLLAMTMLAMVTVVIWQALGRGIQMRDALARDQAEIEDARAYTKAISLLEGAIYEFDLFGEDLEPFEMQDGRLIVAVSDLEVSGVGGHAFLKLELEDSNECSGRDNLVMSWQRALPGQNSLRDWTARRVLMSCLENGAIRALDYDPEEGWIESEKWSEMRLPHAIVIAGDLSGEPFSRTIRLKFAGSTLRAAT